MTRTLTLLTTLFLVLAMAFAAAAQDATDSRTYRDDDSTYRANDDNADQAGRRGWFGRGDRDDEAEVIVLDNGGVVVVPPESRAGDGMAAAPMQTRRQMLMSMTVAPSDPNAILALANWLHLDQDQIEDLQDNIEDTRNDIADILEDDQKQYLGTIIQRPTSLATYCRDLQAGGVVEAPSGRVGSEQEIVRRDASALRAQGASEQATTWRVMLMQMQVGTYDPSTVLALAGPMRLSQDQYNDIVERMRSSRKDAVETLNIRQAEQLTILGPQAMSMDTLCQDLKESGIATPTPGSGELSTRDRQQLGNGAGGEQGRTQRQGGMQDSY